MLKASDISLNFGKRILFDEVNVNFSPGNCYGIIGANGAGKSTFMKILSGELEPNSGMIEVTPGERMAVLKQDHYVYDEYRVIDTVIMGHKKLYDIMIEKDAIYDKPEMTEADGMRSAELETEFAELNGWEAEPEAASLLSSLEIPEDLHEKKMSELEGREKVRVLLAQAVFGDPDILLLDEPTNHLDIANVEWLNNFLKNFKNTVIVISHDRHFLDQICTHICDIDYGKIQMFTGNYTFWYESSQLALRQRSSDNKKKEEKIKEFNEFIRRFSANASKSKQATSRKNLLSKITLDDIKPSSRKYPGIVFKIEKEGGKDLLSVERLSKKNDGETVFHNLDLMIAKGEKVAFVGNDSKPATTLFQILSGEDKADKGEYKWGVSTTQSYMPLDYNSYFDSCDKSLVNWLKQYSHDEDETFLRGFLGRMLFTGEESQKAAKVLSGGEKVRCMLSKMMLSSSNVLILDDPTNHLDLESITALNNAMKDYKGTILFTSHDHELIQTVATRIIEIGPKGKIDMLGSFEEYLYTESIQERRKELY